MFEHYIEFQMLRLMGSFFFEHVIGMVILLLLLIVPIGMILKKLGYSPLWAALALIPIVNVIALWAVALIDRDQARNGSAAAP
jgi:uncharacterized membrane protein